MSEETKTFEIPVKEKPVEKEKLTFESAQKSGWSEKEIEMGKEVGLLVEEAPKTNGTEPKIEDKPKEEEKPKETEKKEPSKETHKASLDDFQLTMDEEKSLEQVLKDPNATDKLKNVAGLYFGRKSERSRAQTAEQERNRVLKENEGLKERLEKLEAKLVEPQQETEDDEKPLTKKGLIEMMSQMEKDRESQKKKNEELTQNQAKKINEALQTQESHARTVYQDFDEVIEHGSNLVKQDSKGQFVNEFNITTLPEQVRKKALVILRQIRSAATRADEMTVDDYTVADMTYDLGQLAKQYAPKKEEKPPSGSNAERTPGGLTPEEEERIKKNQARPGSSASVSGSGGRRVVSVNDITIDDLLGMDSKTFTAFEKAHPERVGELMRG